MTGIERGEGRVHGDGGSVVVQKCVVMTTTTQKKGTRTFNKSEYYVRIIFLKSGYVYYYAFLIRKEYFKIVGNLKSSVLFGLTKMHVFWIQTPKRSEPTALTPPLCSLSTPVPSFVVQGGVLINHF